MMKKIKQNRYWRKQAAVCGFCASLFIALSFCYIISDAYARGRYCRPLKFGHPFNPKSPQGEWADNFGKRLKELDNQIEISVIDRYPYPKMFIEIMKGSLDLALIPSEIVSSIVPEWQVLSLPALFPSWNSVNSLRRQGKFIEKLAGFSREKNAFPVSFGWRFAGIANTKINIQIPKDMKGIKFRAFTAGNKQFVSDAGAVPIPVPYNEIVNAMKAGAVDSTIAAYPLFEKLGKEGIIKSLTWSSQRNLFSMAYVLITNRRFWELTGELQPKLKEIGNDTAEAFELSYKAEEEKAIKNITEAGVKVIGLSEDNYEKWAELSKQTLWKKYVDSVHNGKVLIKLAKEDQQLPHW